jgi:hypothetical protein
MSRPQSGPPLIYPAVAVLVLSIAGLIVGSQAPRPDSTAASVLAYAEQHAGMMRLAAFVSFGASIPLAIWAAAVYRRLRALGVTAPGSAIAFAGGLLAAAMLALSGLITWVGSRADQDAHLAAALRDLSFVTGGVGFVVFFGLLIAGVAVPVLLLRINRPLGIYGLVIAAVSQLASLALLSAGFEYALPVGRFGGLIFLILASVLLPATRPRATPVDSS